MTAAAQSRLLKIIDAAYGVALSPAQYESFAAELDDYITADETSASDAEQLLTHLDKALSVLERLHAIRKREDGPEALVEQEIGAAAMVQPDGEIIATNSAWDRTMNLDAGPVWEISSDTREQEKIKSAMRRLHEVVERRTSFARLEHLSVGVPISLAIRRCLQDDAQHTRSNFLLRSTQQIWSDQISQLVASEFDLTPAEVLLLKRMALGDTFQEISADTRRGIETLRTQSKSIYRKMHVSGREDAVRVALQLHLLLSSGDFVRDTPINGEREGVVRLKSGRRLAWRKQGDLNGRPALFLHGMSQGHGFTDSFLRKLTQEKLCFICIDRPGFGRSDPPKDWRKNVDEWIQIFPEILEALGLGRVPLVTHTTGVLYGCSAAANHPALVSGVYAIAGDIPITDNSMLADYPAQVRIVSRAARFSSQALRFILSTSTAFYRREAGRNRMIERTYSNVPSDRKTLENPDVRDIVHAGLEMIALGGFDGFVGDGLSIFADWSEFVERMQVPLHYILGDQDPICPLKWAQAFSQKYQHVSVTAVEEAGNLLQHSHPDVVINTLIELFSDADASGETLAI